jgi:hypothetical protein
MPGRVLIVIALVVLGICGVLVVGHPSVSDAPTCTYSPANGAYVSVSGPDADRFCSVGDLATAGRGENPPANSIEVCELHSQDRQITLKVFADASSDQTEARNTCADLRTSYPD